MLMSIDGGGVIDARGIRELKLISDIDEGCLQSSSYDLRLGPAHLVYAPSEGEEKSSWQRCFIGKDLEAFNRDESSGEEKFIRQNNNDKHTLTIPACGAAFIQLYEHIDTLSVVKRMKQMVVGRFDLRLRWVNAGLISQQSTQVEPFYKGMLFCFVYNLSNEDIKIKYLERFATIEFLYGTHVSSDELKEGLEKSEKKYEGKIGAKRYGIADIRYFSTSVRLPEQSGLFALESELEQKMGTIPEQLKNDSEFIDSIFEHVERRSTSKIALISAIFGIVLPILITIVANLLAENYGNQQLKERISALEQEVEIVQQSIDVSQGDIQGDALSGDGEQ